MQLTAVHYLPIATTLLAIGFSHGLLQRYRTRPQALHLLWWGVGVITYGTGTALESVITLFGNSVWITKAWYVVGALLGAYPLAQGSVYLLLRRPIAHRLTWITLPCVGCVALLVLLSPVTPGMLEAHRPSGAILQWTWVRGLTPFINVYALLFLVGGALYSAARYLRIRAEGDARRALANGFIATGGTLPGIGGALAKAGHVEALYVGEFIGLILIWIGFSVAVRVRTSFSHPASLSSSR